VGVGGRREVRGQEPFAKKDDQKRRSLRAKEVETSSYTTDEHEDKSKGLPRSDGGSQRSETSTSKHALGKGAE